MSLTLVATQVNFQDLDRWGLVLNEELTFVPECHADLSLVSPSEKIRLDRVKASFTHLLRHPPVLEDAVKITVLSHLLDLADFYTEPIFIRTERSLEVSIPLEDSSESVTLKGSMDILILEERFWIFLWFSKKKYGGAR